MTNQNEVKSFVEHHYDISVMTVTQLTDKIWKLVCLDRVYLLKLTMVDESFVMKQLYAYKELREHVLPIFKTRLGESMVSHEGQVAYLTEYVEQIPMPLEKRVHDYAKMLEKLHAATALHVEKHDEEIRQMYESDYEQLKRNFMLLEQHMEQIEMKITRSPFEWYAMMIYPLLYGMYRRADDMMQKFYKRLERKKIFPVAMTHQDINIANTLSATDTSYLINFEKSNFDLPTTDTVLFLRHYHQVPGVSHMITNYLKNQGEDLVAYHFFLKTLCVDLESLFKTLNGNSLTDISLLNEKIAPSLLAMEIFDNLYQPQKPPKKKAKPAEEKKDDD